MVFSGTFARLTANERRIILARSERQRYQRGEIIIREGRDYNAIVMIDVGWVRIQYQNPTATSFDAVVVARLGPGAIFGDMSFLDHTRSCATVLAETEVEALYLDGAEVDEMVRADPAFAGRFYQSLAVNLAHRLRTTTRRVRTD